MFDFFSDDRGRSKCHVKLSDVPIETLADWHSTVKYAGVDPMITQLNYHKSLSAMHKQMERNKDFLIKVQYMARDASRHISKTHLFVLTDPAGVILGLYSDEATIRQLELVNFTAGASLAIEHAGINGVSAAMQLNDAVVVQGHEHDLQLLSQWTCICAPIKLHDTIIAYLDLSFHASLDVTFAIPILKQLIHKIERALIDDPSSVNQAHIISIFKKYHLSPREKEIALLWLGGSSRGEIAEQKEVSVETVRSHIRNIYRKTGVSRKSEFIKSFLIY